MISRLPRVIYTELPEGQDWIFGEIDDEKVILISEELDRDGRRAAFRAAYASLRKGFPAWVSLPLIAAGSWLSDKVRTPFGSAVTASVLTAAAVYAITTPNDQPRPITDPPAVVTLHPTVEPTALATPAPTAAGTRTSSPPATHRPAPGATRPAVRRDRSSGPARPTRSTSPRRRHDERPTPHPSRTSAPATATPTQAPAPEATLEPPAAGMTPPQSAPGDVEGDGAAGDLSVLDSPGSLRGDTACGGIHVGATLDPGGGLDLCLLD